MSAPAMKALSPAPVRMTPRTATSSRACLEGGPQILPRRRIQRVDHLERHLLLDLLDLEAGRRLVLTMEPFS